MTWATIMLAALLGSALAAIAGGGGEYDYHLTILVQEPTGIRSSAPVRVLAANVTPRYQGNGMWEIVVPEHLRGRDGVIVVSAEDHDRRLRGGRIVSLTKKRRYPLVQLRLDSMAQERVGSCR